MSSFSTYNAIVEKKLANESDIFYTPEIKLQAIQEAAQEIVLQYDIPEMATRDTITFTNGVADIPSNFLRMKKLWDIDSNGNQLAEYEYLNQDEFDLLNSGSSFFWTQSTPVGSSEYKLYIRPLVSSKTLQIRYYKPPAEITTSTGDTGLSSFWDSAVAALAVSFLLDNAGRYEEAMKYKGESDRKVQNAYQLLKNPGGVKQNARFKSVFERTGYMRRGRNK